MRESFSIRTSFSTFEKDQLFLFSIGCMWQSGDKEPINMISSFINKECYINCYFRNGNMLMFYNKTCEYKLYDFRKEKLKKIL